MGEVKLTVPAEHVEAFRLAAADEVGDAAEWLARSQDELVAQLAEGRTRDDDTMDLWGVVPYLQADLSVVDQLAGQDGPVEVRGNTDAIAHIAETMARKIIPPRLTGALGVGPLQGEAHEDVSAVIDSMTWAAGTAAELHERGDVERKVERAAAGDGILRTK